LLKWTLISDWGFWTLERETASPEATIYLMIFYDLDEDKKLAIFHIRGPVFLLPASASLSAHDLSAHIHFF